MAVHSKPTVSVVVVCMNDVDYIEETLNSILSQNYPALEVHVQDGGSKDGTLEILQRYPIRYISEPDEGVPDAANRGIRATTGEIVVALGADDPLLPGALHTLTDALAANPQAGFAYGDIEYIDASSRPYYLSRGRPFDLDQLFWGNHVPAQSVAFRRSALVDVGMYRNGILDADWDLYIRLGARYPSVYIPKLLARYRVHDRSTTLTNLKRFAWSVTYVADTCLSDPAITSRLRFGKARAFAGSYLIAASLYVGAGERGKAFLTFLQAIRAYPRGLFTRRGIGAVVALLIGPKFYYRLRNRGRGKG